MEYIIENWWYLLLVFGFGYMMFKGGGCCGGGHSHGGHSHDGHSHTGHNGGYSQQSDSRVDSQVNMVLDPECGMYIDPDTAVKQNLDGKTYYFCSDNCRNSFVQKQQNH